MTDTPYNRLIVLGASITASPWMTWVDFLEMESGLQVLDLSSKGVGNEFMMQSLATVRDRLDDRTLVVVMFTTIDKWDWYVQDARLNALMEEKHPPKLISPRSGFWCTGSWFPGDKEIFQQNFYNQDYFCAKTIQNILLAKEICKSKQARIEIFFDSPIWNYTEHDLNSMITNDSVAPSNLAKDDLAQSWFDLLDDNEKQLEISSLIGYCWHHDLPWCNTKYKGHPPSSSHWSWYKNIMRPRIDDILDLSDVSSLVADKISQMDVIWRES